MGGRSKVAAFDLTFSAPKSVSVLFAVGESALAQAMVEAHESAVDAALGYLEREACRVRRGRGGVRREVGEGFVAAAYRHRMSRAEDPQLHTHVVAANMARGADGRWTALDATPIYQHAKAAGFLYQAHLRAAVVERLAWVRWGPVRNGMAEIEQVAPAVLREFSTRRRQIVERERELAAAGVEVGDRGREAIAHDTRARKRYGVETAPWRDVVRARAAEHGLGERELAALVRGPARAPEAPDANRVSAELAGAAGLTEKQNTFARRDAVMAWAAAHGQGAPAVAVERAAAAFLMRADVHDAPDPTGRRFTTSDLLAHEEEIVRGAQARRGEGTGRLDDGVVDAVLANAPFAPTAEQAVVVRGVTSSGHGVETVEALAGTGKTFTAGLLAQAYAAGGYRVLGAAPTGRAVRELTRAGRYRPRLHVDAVGARPRRRWGRFRDGSGGADPRRGRDGQHARDRPRHGPRPCSRSEGHRHRRLRSAVKRSGRRLAGLADQAPGLPRVARGDAPARPARAPTPVTGAPRRSR